MSTIHLSGTAKWAKVRPDQKAKSYDETFEEYSIDLYPTDKSWVDFKKSGLQLKDKVDDDGKRFIKLRRKHEEMNWGTGEMQVNGAPVVFIKDDQSGEYIKDKTNDKIGNGSEVTLVVDTYKTRNGVGHRLVRVFVDKLVRYEPRANEADTPDTAKLPF